MVLKTALTDGVEFIVILICRIYSLEWTGSKVAVNEVKVEIDFT